MRARSSELIAPDGRRIVVRWGTGYAPTVNEYSGDRNTRRWNVPGGLARARSLARSLAADKNARQ
jgi:hypothetical protein